MKLTFLLTLALPVLIILTGCEKEADLNDVPVVEAGNSRTIQLPKDTIMLQGTATDADGNITGYFWSMISGPNTPVIHKDGANAAVIQGFVAGSYLFQLMAVDNMGATGVDTVRINVLKDLNPVTLSLQPAQNPTEMYFFGQDDAEGGSSQFSEMGVAWWTRNGGYGEMRTALKFDLSSIPANATIVSAKLSLYSHPNPVNGNHISPNAGSNNAIVVQRITSAWAFATARWHNMPSTTSLQQVVIPSTNLPSLDVVDLDVKDLVSSMVTLGNHGFYMKLQEYVIYNSRLFCSSRYTDAAKHPKLVVNYKLN